ncbi:MAG: hypothetical protein J0I54_01570 [Bosea sp.]|uniref:hypothetical protein n=1 Tax=unclassified Bosea (in: a-proteobacteria) TaxID=2653178 RepID=UPI000AD90830|nr:MULTISPECIES: hypothetical protein [unclassified Bosea (in: a-proteobacteria)]MBN9455293.1 hypothetical protein [Bosea sp. (in: a-proteobacteria)]
MARRPNTFATDPNLRASLDNIASMFAPPSGTDAAGFAAAGLNNAKRKQMEEFYRMATDPNASRDVVDRYGVASGAFTPTNSYYKIGVDSADMRRGQDVTSAATLRKTQMDNDTTLATNKLDNQTKTITSMFGSQAPGYVRPAVPAEVAGVVGLPALPEVQGTTRPQTLDQWQAQEAERLKQSGGWTPDMTVDVIMGRQSPVTVKGKDGRAVYAAPGTAARQGLEAAAAPSSADGKLVEGTAIIAGKPTQVFRAPNSPDYQSADGTPLPMGTQVFEKATPQATQGDLKGTEFSDKNAIFYNRAAPASATMKDLAAKGYVPSGRDYELMLGRAGEMMPLSLSNNLVSDQGRQFYNSAMNFMLSVLRPDTGAAFGREEFQNYARVFIPLPGDDPQTLVNKAAARDTALAALQGTSKGAADKITQLMQSQGLPIPPEMANRLQAAQAHPQQPPAPGREITGTPAGGDNAGALAEARDAIQRGAPREAVIERLRGMGIDPGGL